MTSNRFLTIRIYDGPEFHSPCIFSGKVELSIDAERSNEFGNIQRLFAKAEDFARVKIKELRGDEPDSKTLVDFLDEEGGCLLYTKRFSKEEL